MAYYKTHESNKKRIGRTKNHFMESIEKVFGARKDTISFEHLKRWQNIFRKPGQTFLEYFILYEDLMGKAADPGCLGKPEALFVKTYLSLRLTPAQASKLN